MAREDDFNELPRRVMTLFLLVDTSGSMITNRNIEKVNSAIEEMIPLLKEVSDENAEAEIKIAVMEFSTGCRWVTHDELGQEGAESLDTFVWNNLKASGLTDMGAAFTELESKLSRSAFMKSTTGAYAPVIILLSDGQPTDDIKPGMDKLKSNNWYRAATKIAISVDDGDDAVLATFTGSIESVLKVNSDRDDLKRMVCKLAVFSSTRQSRSVTAGNSGSDDDVAKQLAKEAVDQVKDDNNSGTSTDPWGSGGW